MTSKNPAKSQKYLCFKDQLQGISNNVLSAAKPVHEQTLEISDSIYNCSSGFQCYVFWCHCTEAYHHLSAVWSVSFHQTNSNIIFATGVNEYKANQYKDGSTPPHDRQRLSKQQPPYKGLQHANNWIYAWHRLVIAFTVSCLFNITLLLIVNMHY